MAKTQEAHTALDADGWAVRWLQIDITLVKAALTPYNIPKVRFSGRLPRRLPTLRSIHDM